MSGQDYKDLNYYLNLCCNYLRYGDSFYLDNISKIAYLSQMFVECANKHELKVVEEEEPLTFNDVFLLAREIVESINPKYLENFDNIITNGELDFSYDNLYWGSHMHNKNDVKEININRTFNYDDVCVLVHEFIHYQNQIQNNISINHYLLSEFLSIYYEIYAGVYLVRQKQVSISKIDFDKRILCTKTIAKKLTEYSFPFLAFEKFGNIDESSVDMISQFHLAEIEKKEFEAICLKFIEVCKMKEKEYINEIRYEENLKEYELARRIGSIFYEDYRYILGTLLAYHALEHCDIKQVTYLNDHIYEDKYRNMSLPEVIKIVDINITDAKIVEKLLSSLEKGLNKGDLCKK